MTNTIEQHQGDYFTLNFSIEIIIIINVLLDTLLCNYRVLPKRATALQFTNDDQYILISDKAGDLYRYSVSDSASPGEHLLGHFSILLDMVGQLFI